MSEISTRIHDVYIESESRSVTAFAKRCGINQKSMDNYIKGINEPSIKALSLIADACPIYNREWLIHGTGPKYNPDYVGNSDPANWYSQETIDMALNTNANTANNNSGNVTQTIEGNNNDLVAELKRSRERLLERMIHRLKYTIDRCKTTSEMTEELECLLLELEIEKK